MISVEQAQDRMLTGVQSLANERVELSQSYGRVLSEDVYATMDMPRFDNSSMDGYAVVAADLAAASAENPIKLAIDGVNPAGRSRGLRLERGHARKIMTGAPIPEGADAVIPVEQVREADNAIWISAPELADRYIRSRGQDVAGGTLLLSRGHYLTPALIGMLASQGHAQVSVTRQPRIAILATGDELVEPGQTLGDGQILNSNSYALAAAVQAAGGIPWRMAIVADREEAVASALHDAASKADLIISSGGVSVGDYDFVKQVVERMGHLDFWRVDMKPGKPVAFGTLQGKPFLGLPGNPVSSLVTFELFARPLIHALLGNLHGSRLTVPLPLAVAFTEISDRRHYVRVRIAADADENLMAWPTGAQDSHRQSSWLSASGLMIVPPNQGPLPEGSVWPVMLLSS